MSNSHRLRHSAQELMVQARAETSIDIVDKDIAEALEKYIFSLNTEARLNERGALELEKFILFALANRLRMMRDFRVHPEIAEQKIVRPLIINGMARTGSTKLQKLLAASGDFLWLPCWQGLSLSLLSGDRGEDPAVRIDAAEEFIQWLDRYSPNTRLIHEYSAKEPEEENIIMAQCFYGPYMNAFAFVPGYFQWYMQNRDPEEDFSFLKQCLQYLQWQFHDGDARPWILKAPSYLGYETAVAAVFPDVAFVTTHRDPVAILSSSLSLVESLFSACSDESYRHVLGLPTAAYLAQGKEAQMALKDAHPEIPWLDVAYKEITRDAEAAAERIYAFAGIELTDKARQAMRDWETRNAQHKHGAHEYKLENFGVKREQVNKLFTNYIARYKACL